VNQKLHPRGAVIEIGDAFAKTLLHFKAIEPAKETPAPAPAADGGDQPPAQPAAADGKKTKK
jgi:hypothetical protein